MISVNNSPVPCLLFLRPSDLYQQPRVPLYNRARLIFIFHIQKFFFYIYKIVYRFDLLIINFCLLHLFFYLSLFLYWTRSIVPDSWAQIFDHIKWHNIRIRNFLCKILLSTWAVLEDWPQFRNNFLK